MENQDNNQSNINQEKYLNELKELRDNYNQLKKENQELRNFKSDIEINAEKSKLYQKYAISKQDQGVIDNFLNKYQLRTIKT
jgi:hypothetical protein